MNTKEKLQQQIDELTRKEAQEATELQYLIDNFKGKTFARIHAAPAKNTWGRSRGVWMVHYHDFVRKEHGIEVTKDEVEVATSSIRYRPVGITAKLKTTQTIHDLNNYSSEYVAGMDVTRREIPHELLLAVVAESKNLANLWVARLVDEIEHAQSAPPPGKTYPELLAIMETPSIHKTCEISCDLPHLDLEPWEANELSGSPFLVNYRLFLSPNAIEHGLMRVREGFEKLGRGAGFYQECDMAYVDWETRILTTLRDKLHAAAAKLTVLKN